MRAILNVRTKEVISVFDGAMPGDRAADQVIVPVVENPAEFDPSTHKRTLDRYEISAAKVIRHWIVAEKTPQEIYDEHLAAGYVDAETGLKLKTTERAIELFSQLASHIVLALSLNEVELSTSRVIFDYDDAPHELTIGDLRPLLYRYGLHCAQIHHDYAP